MAKKQVLPTANLPRGKPFKKGNTLRADGRSGRRAGTENVLNQQCKEMIASCFQNIGGLDGLEKWAKDNRTAFYTRMYVRLLGVDINVIQADAHKKIVYETVEQVNERLGEKGLTLDMLRKLCEYEERRPKLIEHVRIDGSCPSRPGQRPAAAIRPDPTAVQTAARPARRHRRAKAGASTRRFRLLPVPDVGRRHVDQLVDHRDQQAPARVLQGPQGRHLGRYLDRNANLENLKVLRYPAIAEEATDFRRIGEPLFPQFKPKELLLERKHEMSIGSWEAEYQQHPIVVGGGQLPIDKLKVVPTFARENVMASVRYVDKAGTVSDDAAYSAFVLMHRMKDKTYVIEHVLRGRWSALDRERKLKELCDLLVVVGLGDVDVNAEQADIHAGVERGAVVLPSSSEYEVKITLDRRAAAIAPGVIAFTERLATRRIRSVGVIFPWHGGIPFASLCISLMQTDSVVADFLTAIERGVSLSLLS
jgi:hypothetical protein